MLLFMHVYHNLTNRESPINLQNRDGRTGTVQISLPRVHLILVVYADTGCFGGKQK